jgi:thiosulfate/3-mercaptopyruvate sulfurtransferase
VGSPCRPGSLGPVNTAPLDAALPESLVSPSWLAAHLGPPVVVLDATVILPAPAHDGDYRVRSGRERFADGHIPTARYADLLGDLSDHDAPYHFARPSADRLAAALERLGVTNRSVVVTYDSAGGVWAARLWWMLRWIGVRGAVLDGGWRAWVASGGAVESGPPVAADLAGLAADPPAGLGAGVSGVMPREHPGMWAGQEDVAEVVRGARSASLVCALSAELFAGTTPTRYTRRGHIPSSVSVPARALMTADGCMLPRAQLMEAAGVIPEGGPVIVYCGGGISAAVVAQSLTIIGREDVAIYDGSLEEWSADPDLPVELGP